MPIFQENGEEEINSSEPQPVTVTGGSISVTSSVEVTDQEERNPFNQFLTDDGTTSGSEDMTVDGSSTSQDFYISADATKNRFIVSINFRLAGNGASISEFADIAALANGVQVIHDFEGSENILTLSPITTNFDLLAFGHGTPPFGSGPDAFRVPNATGNLDYYFPTVNFQTHWGLQKGMLLRVNSADKMLIRIRDDLTAVGEFTATAFGFDQETN